MLNDEDDFDKDEYMTKSEASFFIGICATKIIFHLIGRISCKRLEALVAISGYMSRPLRACMGILKRVARYLRGWPSIAQMFPLGRLRISWKYALIRIVRDAKSPARVRVAE